jgi:hypothetical protein
MTDAIQCLKPGIRMTDSSNEVLSGAVIKMFESGTTTPRTMYSDRGLSVSLGVTVTCDSAGYPTSNGTTKCEIYTGNTPYKLRLETSGGSTVWEHDGIVGALDTSTFATSTAPPAAFSAKSADYTVVDADNGTLFEFDSTAADRTATLPSAVTVGADFVVGIRKKVAANSVIVASVSAQTIRHDVTTAATTFTMTGIGDYAWFQSDGANWIVRDLRLRVLPAGTTAQPPLKQTAGTLTTTPEAGALEYDGAVHHSSFAASQRGISPSMQIVTVAPGAKTSLTNNITTAQNIFASANDGLTVVGATTYRFRARIALNTGNTSHTTAFGIGLVTATLTSINYTSTATSSAADTLAAAQIRRVVSNASAAVLTAASTAVQTEILLEGIMRVNAAGSIFPQITFSAGPTGTCEVDVDSFFELWPIGSNTVVSEGPWA